MGPQQTRRPSDPGWLYPGTNQSQIPIPRPRSFNSSRGCRNTNGTLHSPALNSSPPFIINIHSIKCVTKVIEAAKRMLSENAPLWLHTSDLPPALLNLFPNTCLGDEHRPPPNARYNRFNRSISRPWTRSLDYIDRTAAYRPQFHRLRKH